MEGDERSGAADATLDRVEDQKRAVAVGDPPGGDEVFLAEGNDAPLPHDRLEDDRAGGFVYCPFQRGDVIRRNECGPGNEWLEGGAIGGVTGERECAKGPAVKALLARHDSGPPGSG